MADSARVMRWSCAVVILAALAALAGKWLNAPLLASGIPMSIPMAPSTACAFLLLAAALHPDLPWKRSVRVRVGLLLPVFFLSLPSLVMFVARIQEGGWASIVASRPFAPWMNLWVMSPLTASLFFVVGAAAATFLWRGPGRASTTAACGAAFVATASSVILIGYLYGVPMFYGGLIIPMAATTAACFLALAAALLIELGGGLWPWSLFEGDSPQALMMRSFLPISAGITIFIGFVHTQFELAGNTLTDAALVITALLLIAWMVAKISSRVGAAIESAERRAGASEARVREEAQSRKKLTDLVPGVIYQFRLYPDGRSCFPYANSGMNDIYEVAPEEVREDATPVFGRIHPEDLEGTSAAIQDSARALTLFHWEFRVILPRQGLRWRLCDAKPERLADGGTLWYGIITDITERKQADQSLNKSRQLLAQAEAMGKVGGWEFDVATMNLSWTEGTYRIHELERSVTPTLRSALDFYAPESRPVISQAVQRAIENGEPFDLELEIVTAKGNRRSLHVIGNPDAENRQVRGFIQDITERKKNETALANLQKLESLGTLAGGIAHDFNNMLTSVLGGITLLKDGTPSEGERQQIVQEAMSACLSAKGLAKQLMTFASGGVPKIEIVDLAELTREAASFSTRGTGVRCDVSAAGGCLAKVDKDQIAQVVQNLVLNAAQAMPEGGTVSLDLARSGELIQLQVKDTGTGISKEHLTRIFDPFFSTKGQGRGLGLSMCHSIVARHGGSISVDSRLGGGTTFTILFPAAAASERPAPAEVAAQPIRTGSGRVLIMDDELGVVTVLGRMLDRLGYASEAAPEGKTALALYKSARESGKPFDAVIMDLTIAGGMGGAEAVRRLLELDPKAKVIVSSGYSDDPIVAEYAEHGFCDALIKPYRMEDVSTTLARVIAPS